MKMVQRKVQSKLCIQTDHLRSENREGKLRPPSPRFQDGINKGAEMKKKMKKSKSMNCSTIASCLKSPNFLKQVPQPGKPPPDEKQKQSPNYMRSTSSFEARKEKPQVSFQASVKSPKKELKNSKPSSNSGQNIAKTITKTSSLKRVRTLMKAPSFKPARAANKKCSQVVFCKDSNSLRATCSSTLKDSKFPNYLKLSHGATESDGTSLMKVCPYTYCSLNGHRHALLPPLKSFLSAKRHILKTQKVLKLSCLSPRKTARSGDLEIESSGKIVINEKAAVLKPDVQEDNMDFYIKIYVENKGKDSKTINGRKGDGDVYRLSNEALNSGNKFENNLSHCSEVNLMKKAIELFPETVVLSAESNQEEEISETVSNQSEMELNGTDSETYDMEWEEGKHPAKDEIKDDSEISFVLHENEPSFHDENAFTTTYLDEIPVDEKEKIFVKTEKYEIEFINKNKDEVSIVTVQVNEASSLLGNQVQHSGEPQRDEIHEDYESITSSTKMFDFDVSGEDVIVGNLLVGVENSVTNQSLEYETEAEKQDDVKESLIDIPMVHMTTGGESNEVSDDKLIFAETCISKNKNFVDDQNDTEINNDQAQSFNSSDFTDSEDQAHSGLNTVVITDQIISDIDVTELSHSDTSDLKESFSAEKDETIKQAKLGYTRQGGRSSEDLQNNTINIRIIKCKKSEEKLEKEREFNPREPNFLPIKPDLEAEKVDLRHQDLEDRKNAEEWMLDYALQQTVTRLAPARKRKVALLVEAFEKVTPHHYEPRLRHSPAAFTSSRPIQACS